VQEKQFIDKLEVLHHRLSEEEAHQAEQAFRKSQFSQSADDEQNQEIRAFIGCCFVSSRLRKACQ
jgi:hypothetical protein